MIDINNTTADEIDTIAALKGHGYEIVRHRQEGGGFTDLRQLNEVPRLSRKTDGIEAQVEISD